MGTFGTGLYDDDHAMDIKSLFKDLQRGRVVGARATDILLENCFEGNPKSLTGDPVFWLVLLDLQWKSGVLDERVKARSVEVIASKEGLEMWEDPSDRRAREKVYEKLALLLSKPPPEQKITGEAYFDASPWKVGEIVAYRLGKRHEKVGDKVVLLQVVSWYKRLGGSSPTFELLNWMGDQAPPSIPNSLEVLNTFNPIPMIDLFSDEIQDRIRSCCVPHT